VFVYGETKRHLVAYPAMNIPKNFASREADLIHDLELISQLAGEVTMSQDAIAWGTQWYSDHYASTKSMPLEESKWGGYWARKQTHIHKLAMVLSAAESDDLIIRRHHLSDAAAIVTQLEDYLPRIFELVGQSADARIAEAVREVVPSNFAVDKAALFKRLSKTYSPREVEDALHSSIRAGLIGVRQMGNRTLLMDLEKELYDVAAQSQYVGTKPSATSE
jgi:hypothetical protein